MKGRIVGFVVGFVVPFLIVSAIGRPVIGLDHISTYTSEGPLYAKWYLIVGDGPNRDRLPIPGTFRDIRETPRKRAYHACEPFMVESLAAELDTRPTPDAVARRYSQMTPGSPLGRVVFGTAPRVPTALREAVYEGCLEDFRSKN